MTRVMRPSCASRATSPSGRSSTRDGAEPVERGDDDERARPRRHQHADVLALAHADVQQAGDDVVDARPCRPVRVRAVLEQEEDAVAVAAGLLVEQQRERDLRAALDLAEAGEAGQRRRRPRG